MSYTTFIDVDTPHNFDDFVERFLKVCKALTDSSNRACSITPIEEISPLADPKACWAGLSHDLARAFPRRVSVTFATEEEARI